MEGNRNKHTLKKLSINQQGASLFAAILIALFALLALSGLYFALTKLLSSSHTIKTYASIRDAAAGGVNYIITIINELESQNIWVGPDNPNPHSYSSPGDCIQNPITINFRLTGSSSLYENRILICFFSSGPQAGLGVHGVTYAQDVPGVYTIISEAEGPQNTRSRIEAVYLHPPR